MLRWFTATLLLLGSYCVFADEAALPAVPPGHPRVYVRPSDLPAIRQKIATPEFAPLWQDVSTGCRDEVAAQGVAGQLDRRAELVKAEIISPAEDSITDHALVPLADHLAQYVAHLEAKGDSPGHRRSVALELKRLAQNCKWGRLADLKRDTLENRLQVEFTSTATEITEATLASTGQLPRCKWESRTHESPARCCVTPHRI